MRIINRHFTTLALDSVAFTSFIPVYLLSLLAYSLPGVEIPASPPFTFILLGWLLVDGSHVYSTLLVSYTDPEIRRSLRGVLIATPICLFAIAFGLHLSGHREKFIIFLALLALVHFIRQEYGWMKLASRFDPETPLWLHRLDSLTSYGMTCLPMLWFLRDSQMGFWYQSGDLFNVPDPIGDAALNLYFPVVAVFLLGNFWHIVKTRRLNVSKFLVFVNTFFGWYMAKVHAPNGYVATWLLIFHHGLPYYFLVFHRERVSRPFLERLGGLRWPVLYLGCVLAFGVFYYTISLNPQAMALKNVPVVSSFLYAMTLLPPMTHFVLDGFIWRKKYGLLKR